MEPTNGKLKNWSNYAKTMAGQSHSKNSDVKDTAINFFSVNDLLTIGGRMNKINKGSRFLLTRTK